MLKCTDDVKDLAQKLQTKFVTVDIFLCSSKDRQLGTQWDRWAYYWRMGGLKNTLWPEKLHRTLPISSHNCHGIQKYGNNCVVQVTTSAEGLELYFGPRGS